MKDNLGRAVDRTYRIQGDGGQGACIAIQSVLQEHGLCGYTEWTSPHWQFMYLTHLEADKVLYLLGDLGQRFQVALENNINGL